MKPSPLSVLKRNSGKVIVGLGGVYRGTVAVGEHILIPELRAGGSQAICGTAVNDGNGPGISLRADIFQRRANRGIIVGEPASAP